MVNLFWILRVKEERCYEGVTMVVDKVKMLRQSQCEFSIYCQSWYTVSRTCEGANGFWVLIDGVFSEYDGLEPAVLHARPKGRACATWKKVSRMTPRSRTLVILSTHDVGFAPHSTRYMSLSTPFSVKRNGWRILLAQSPETWIPLETFDLSSTERHAIEM